MIEILILPVFTPLSPTFERLLSEERVIEPRIKERLAEWQSQHPDQSRDAFYLTLFIRLVGDRDEPPPDLVTAHDEMRHFVDRITVEFNSLTAILALALDVGRAAIFTRPHESDFPDPNVKRALEAFLVRTYEALHSYVLLLPHALGDAEVALGSAFEAIAKFHHLAAHPDWLPFYELASLKTP